MSTIAAPVAEPIETVTPIKPSEAMRLGRVLYPRIATGRFAVHRGGGRYAVCALGAMEVGYGWTPSGNFEALTSLWDPIERHLPRGLYRCVADCPDATRRTTPMAIYHLNDQHDWTTDQIATWLEGLGL